MRKSVRIFPVSVRSFPEKHERVGAGVLFRGRFTALTLLLGLFFLAGTGVAHSGLSAQAYGVVFDDSGRKAPISRDFRRIVALAPSMSETVYALGEGSRLVGRSEMCDFPPEVLGLPVLASYGGVNIEALIAARADLALDAHLNGARMWSDLESRGLTVLSFDPNHSVDGTLRTLLLVGEVLKVRAKAEVLVNSLREGFAELQRAVAPLSKPTVYVVLDYGESGDWTAGKDTFINELVTRAGGLNIATKLEGWQFSREALALADPEVILFSGPPRRAENFKSNSFYRGLRAVRQGRVYALDENLLSRPGPRLLQAAREIALALHPELRPETFGGKNP